MNPQEKKTIYKKIALALSLCGIILWSVLGAGASLAWFTDTSSEINNIFHFADFDLVVSHRLPDGSWEEIDSQTKLFNEQALYEPGYVQVVYLKVENRGDVPFNFYTAVNANGAAVVNNVFGQPIILQEHLKFGVAVADSETAMEYAARNREEAEQLADMPLHNYHQTGVAELTPNTAKYLVLVVRMPRQVGNAANYRGDTAPQVELGITVKADQIRK